MSELVNLTFYSSIPRTSLSPDAFLLYEEIKKKGKKGDVIKTGRKSWKNSLIYNLHRNHNFDSLKIFNAFDELKEKNILNLFTIIQRTKISTIITQIVLNMILNRNTMFCM